MNHRPGQKARVGHICGALPVLILLGALFVSVCWWIEPLRFRILQATVDVHPAVAQRALHDESERIVMLGCDDRKTANCRPKDGH